MYKEVGVPERTGRRILNSTTSRRTGKLRKGRPCEIGNKVAKKIIAFATKDYNHRISKWEDLRKRFYPWVKQARTIKNALEARGYYKCKACQKSYLRQANVEKRDVFCGTRQLWTIEDWKQVRFTDEVHFQLESRRAEYIMRKRDERH